MLSNPVGAQNNSVWDFVVGMSARKAMLNLGRYFQSTTDCIYLINKKISNTRKDTFVHKTLLTESK